MRAAALAHFEPSPARGALIFFGLVAVVVIYLLRDVRRHPWVPRSGCNGGIRRSRWNPAAFGFCRKRRHRDGNHMRRRFGAPR